MQGAERILMYNILNQILDLIFPPVCSFCGKINQNWLCNSCKDKLSLVYKIDKYKYKFFEEHVYIAYYEGLMREGILNYKFHRSTDTFLILL